MPLRKLTLLEIDAILQSAEAKEIHAELHLPDPGNILFKKDQVQLTLGHLSDERNGLHVRESRYDVDVDEEYYPTGGEVNTDIVMYLLHLTNALPTVPLIPPVGEQYEIFGVQMVGGGAFAANVAGFLQIQNVAGLTYHQIWNDGAPAAITGNEDVPVWPVDGSGYMTGAVAVIGHAPIPTDNTYYLVASLPLIGVGETCDFHVHLKRRKIGGLRQ